MAQHGGARPSHRALQAGRRAASVRQVTVVHVGASSPDALAALADEHPALRCIQLDAAAFRAEAPHTRARSSLLKSLPLIHTPEIASSTRMRVQCTTRFVP